jgi:hypothetical protein
LNVALIVISDDDLPNDLAIDVGRRLSSLLIEGGTGRIVMMIPPTLSFQRASRWSLRALLAICRSAVKWLDGQESTDARFTLRFAVTGHPDSTILAERLRASFALILNTAFHEQR